MALLAALSEAIESRPTMRGHAARVTRLAEMVAVRLGWSAASLDGLRIGGRLHDVGKLAVDERILAKPGRLTPAELSRVRDHPAEGARMISHLPCCDVALPYVLYHHERWDGTGYPCGRLGEEIPIEARVLAVADAFDAMTSDRAYRRGMPVDDALTILYQGRNQQ